MPEERQYLFKGARVRLGDKQGTVAIARIGPTEPPVNTNVEWDDGDEGWYAAEELEFGTLSAGSFDA